MTRRDDASRETPRGPTSRVTTDRCLRGSRSPRSVRGGGMGNRWSKGETGHRQTHDGRHPLKDSNPRELRDTRDPKDRVV